jgi:hypothetical protein
MAASKKQMSWSAVGLTLAGTANVLTSIDSITIDQGGDLAKYKGDASLWNTFIVNNNNDPVVTINTTDPAGIMGFAVGATGSFTATHNDAKLATGGSIIYALSNAVVANNSTAGNHAAYGTAVLQLTAFSSDGVTNPLAFTRA